VTNLNQYDSRNRLTNSVWRSVSTALALFAYTVAPTGNRTALAETVNGTSHNYTWSYDYLYRLTSEGLGNLGTVNYGFDQAGNRTNRTSSVSGINYQTPTYTANDWLASDTYDTNGNTTASGTANYQYDLLNHLTNVNSGQILFTYDGDGNRMSKTVGGVTTYYLVDDRNPSGYGQVVEEYTGTSLSRVYNYGLALVSQRQVSGGAVSYYGVDGHGSVRFLTDGSGTVTDTYQYDAYGLEVGNTGSTPNNHLYSGQQYDPDLGMYYLRARYYKPDTGRFWTMDTYGGGNEDPLSLHKYLYCQGNPVNRWDPSGLDPSFTLGGFSVSASIGTTIDALGMPTLTRAFAVAMFRTITAAIAIEVGLQLKKEWKSSVFRYDPVPGKASFLVGTYVTDNPNLTWSQAVNITFFEGMNYLYVYQLTVRPADLGPALNPVMGVRQWQLENNVYNVKIIRTMSKEGGGSSVF